MVDLPCRGSSGRERLWTYRELRDDRICLYLDRLPEGAFEMSYTLRAETPGTFHGLPTLGSAMYVPEVRGNSAELSSCGLGTNCKIDPSTWSRKKKSPDPAQR